MAAWIVAGFLGLQGSEALGLPSFAIQTDQPCSACHVYAFGPRLTQAGRDFKLYGYVANDTRRHTLPISVMGSASFTRTNADQLANEIDGYNKNNNITADEVAAFYGGTLVEHVGAFAEVSYDIVENSLHWEDLDIRRADEVRLFGQDAVLGVSLNNSPTITDLWDSEPSWMYPYAESGLMPEASAAPLIDKVPYTVLGGGGYAMLADTLYLETDLYGGLDHGALRALGTHPLEDQNHLSGPGIYWRAALQREFNEGEHYIAFGTYGFAAAVQPPNVGSYGSDHYTDIAVDGTYQWIMHPERSTSDMLSAHALYLHETADLTASAALFGAHSRDTLSTFRMEATYVIGATYSGTVQRFQTTGSTDKIFWGTPSGNPETTGWTFELDYIPWGKPDSPVNWLNGRLALQYRAYTRFNGMEIGASDNNTLLLNLTFGAAANR